jgi:ABC-2 type transport system ATP-binding protein
MDGKVILEAHNLTKIYRSFFSRYEVKALDNLNLEVSQGEVFGLLGPNGSGKTTTMKIFMGLINPTSGNALLLGRPPHDVSVKERIGFLPEESYLHKFLNADETLDFYGRLFRMPSSLRRKKADELLDLLGLAWARKRLVREYSKGMMRRLAFAQAIINDPDVIFLDEPTSGLDPLMSRHIKDIILDLKKKGKTIFLSSHLLADVENVCDRVIILHNGVTQKIGAVKDLLTINELSEITVKGLSPELEAKLKEFIRKEGAEMVSVQKPTESLEALFLKTIKDKTPPTGITYDGESPKRSGAGAKPE